jgi:hypothetical protein
MGATATGLTELVDDLRKATKRTVPDTKSVVGQGSLNIKRDAQRIIRAASRYGYLPHYPRSITYDVKTASAVVTGEIGPVEARLQGGLGRLLENGSVNNAPIPHLSPALDLEEPRFIRAMEELAEKILDGVDVPGGPSGDTGGG